MLSEMKQVKLRLRMQTNRVAPDSTLRASLSKGKLAGLRRLEAGHVSVACRRRRRPAASAVAARRRESGPPGRTGEVLLCEVACNALCKEGFGQGPDFAVDVEVLQAGQDLKVRLP